MLSGRIKTALRCSNQQTQRVQLCTGVQPYFNLNDRAIGNTIAVVRPADNAADGFSALERNSANDSVFRSNAVALAAEADDTTNLTTTADDRGRHSIARNFTI